MSDKPPLYLDFADFKLRMRKDDNFFTRILSRKYDVRIVDKPDVLIYSDAEDMHRLFTCRRIFYAAEVVRPDFWVSDYAMTLHELEDPRHLRLRNHDFATDPAFVDRVLLFLTRAIEDKGKPVAMRCAWKHPGRWMLLKRNPPRVPGEDAGAIGTV